MKTFYSFIFYKFLINLIFLSNEIHCNQDNLILNSYNILQSYYGSFKRRFESGKISRQMHIVLNDMTDSMLSDVKMIVLDAIAKQDSWTKMITTVSKEMHRKYRAYNWQICTLDFYGTYCFQKVRGTFVSFKMANVQFAIFGTNK